MSYVLRCIRKEDRTQVDYFGIYDDRQLAVDALVRVWEGFEADVIERTECPLADADIIPNADCARVRPGTLSEKSVQSVIRNMAERWGFEITAEEVQAIAAKQSKRFFEIIGNDGISDTLPRGYWLDAIAREWAGREYWPANMDPPDPTFGSDLIAGYERMKEARNAH